MDPATKTITSDYLKEKLMRYDVRAVCTNIDGEEHNNPSPVLQKATFAPSMFTTACNHKQGKQNPNEALISGNI